MGYNLFYFGSVRQLNLKGLCQDSQGTFETVHSDIVLHPNCDTNTFKTLDKIYKDHKKEQKDLYEEREYFSQKK